jgi:hypothetical protein
MPMPIRLKKGERTKEEGGKERVVVVIEENDEL